jgi:hypothetical protein
VYVCMYVSVCMYIRYLLVSETHVCAYIYIYIYIYVYIHTLSFRVENTRIWVRTNRYAYKGICIHEVYAYIALDPVVHGLLLANLKVINIHIHKNTSRFSAGSSGSGAPSGEVVESYIHTYIQTHTETQIPLVSAPVIQVQGLRLAKLSTQLRVR